MILSYNTLLHHCQRFGRPDVRRALFQLGINISGLGLCLMAAYASLSLSYVVTVFFSLGATFFVIRLFIIQHDCGHGSFLPSRAANQWIGRIISFLTFAPYTYWKRSHDRHHAQTGRIDKSAEGYIHLLTVLEYQALPRMDRFFYRLYRHPLVLLVFGIPFHNIILQRFPSRGMDTEDVSSVLWHDFFLFLFYGGLCGGLGWAVVVKVYLPVAYLIWLVGGWMFYVHHHHEDAYWRREQDWTREVAMLSGSSYYVLPRLCHWLTGYIGLHHIHHLCPGVPHYNLWDCLQSSPELQQMNRVTFRQSIRLPAYALYDEKEGRMIRFSEITCLDPEALSSSAPCSDRGRACVPRSQGQV